MRHPSSVFRHVVIVLALCLTTHAHADDRSDARAHFQAGVKFYGGGDYRSAIREFSAAQQIAPADLNNYNLGLCYDKLGDAEPAIQYYRAFLDKQPGTDKRAEIQASIERLEAASRSAATKRGSDKPVAPPVAAPIAPPAVAPPAVVPAAPAAPLPDAAARPPQPTIVPPPPPAVPPAPDAAAAPWQGPAEAAPLETPPAKRKRGPAVAAPAPTGDPQLDRLNSIDVDQIRDQRGLGNDGRAAVGGPAVGANGAPPSQPGALAAPSPQGQPVPPGPDQPKKESAIYTKWWFWAVVAVSGYVVYELATSNSSSSSSGRTVGASPPPRTGLTLLRW